MMDLDLENRKPRVTLIQRLNGSVFVLELGGEKIEFNIREPLQDIRAEALSPSWEVGVEHLQMRKIDGLQMKFTASTVLNFDKLMGI